MKWILCDERLPKEGQMVLTTIRGHDVIIVQDEETFEEAIERAWNEVCYVSVGFIGSDGWYGADGYPLIVHPIAWMPLPKPYKADRKTENSSEKPNNCEYAENPSGDVWECGCFLDTYCEHQIYDRNPDGTINIVECGYESKDEPTISKMEQVDKDINVRSKTEPQIGEMMTEEEFDSMLARVLTGKDEPQTESTGSPIGDYRDGVGAWQTDCAWK